MYSPVNTQRFQKLTYLHLFIDCFMKITPQSSEQTQLLILNRLHALGLYIIFWWGPVNKQATHTRLSDIPKEERSVVRWHFSEKNVVFEYVC